MTQNTIHSKFLIHWTGSGENDFDSTKDVANIDDEIRANYVKRLKDDCEKGLYMNSGREEIYGIGGVPVGATISRVCFTEIKLSQTQRHASRYGKLGIGFNRDFILERGGNPVFYVQNGDKSHIIKNLYCLLKLLGNDSQERKALEIVFGYLKKMSDPNQSELEYYDEMEWRIVHLDQFMGKYFAKRDKKENVYRVDLKPEDVKIIIFPDSQTRELAFKDSFITHFFKDYQPVIITLSDCKNF